MEDMPTPDLRPRLRSALTAAMRAREADAVSAIRSAMAAIDNAEAVPVEVAPAAGAIEASALGVGAAEAPRRTVEADEQQAIVRAEVAERLVAAEQIEATDPVRAEHLRAGADALRQVLAGE